MAHTLSLKLPSTACSPSALRGSHHAEDPSVLASGNGLGYESSSLPISSRRFNFVCSSGALHAASSSANLRLRVESSFCCLTLDSRNLEVTLAFHHSFSLGSFHVSLLCLEHVLFLELGLDFAIFLPYLKFNGHRDPLNLLILLSQYFSLHALQPTFTSWSGHRIILLKSRNVSQKTLGKDFEHLQTVSARWKT